MDNQQNDSFLLSKKLSIKKLEDKKFVKITSIEEFKAENMPVLPFYKPISKIFKKAY